MKQLILRPIITPATVVTASGPHKEGETGSVPRPQPLRPSAGEKAESAVRRAVGSVFIKRPPDAAFQELEPRIRSPSMESTPRTRMRPVAPAVAVPRPTGQATRCLLITLALVSAAAAQVTTVDFEGLSSMANSPGSSVPLVARLHDQLLSTVGIVFQSESTNSYVAVVNIGAGTSSPVNAIGGVGGTGALSYNTPVLVEFFLPASPSTPAVTHFVSIRNDTIPLASGTMTLQAFDASGALLGTDTQTDNRSLTLSVTNTGIHSIRISETSGTIAFDDLRFGEPLVAADQPRIEIALTSSSLVRLDWPSYASNFIPESAGEFPSVNGWETVTNLPVLVDARLVVSNLTAQGIQFYRLKKNP
jgi:hypothetical protein